MVERLRSSRVRGSVVVWNHMSKKVWIQVKSQPPYPHVLTVSTCCPQVAELWPATESRAVSIWSNQAGSLWVCSAHGSSEYGPYQVRGRTIWTSVSFEAESKGFSQGGPKVRTFMGKYWLKPRRHRCCRDSSHDSINYNKSFPHLVCKMLIAFGFYLGEFRVARLLLLFFQKY